jgi:hypothetical protein
VLNIRSSIQNSMTFSSHSSAKRKTAIQLTVLSALARLGVDPWGEAARLSELTSEAATSALAAAIAALPAGDWKASDSRSIAVTPLLKSPNQ